MAKESEEVPEGAAVVPLIPEKTGISPWFLAVFHALVFLEGSSEEIVDPAAADEASQYLATYLQRISGDELKQLKEDLKRLQDYASRQHWTPDQLQLVEGFLDHYGIKKH
jgi:hypothetical protein